MSTFCSPKSKLTFNTFDTVLESGKIVVLNINISEYNMLSKIIATYLKLDFQTEIMTRLSKNISKTSAFICDEYDKFASKTDGEFFSLSREAKCINIVSTQSYSSLKSTLKDDSSVKVIIQNLINKIWFRTDDSFTIEDAQKQLGKEEKENEVKIHSIPFKDILLLAIATSIDALAVGVSFAFLKVNLFLAITTIGITTFILSFVCVLFGKKLGSLFEKYAEYLGGIILILLGIKILIEHLFF